MPRRLVPSTNGARSGGISRDVEAVEVLFPLVRGWVVAAEPATEVVARRFVRAAAGLALWASRFVGQH